MEEGSPFMKRQKRNTCLLALGLLTLLLAGLGLVRLMRRGGELRAVVRRDGETVAVLPLTEPRELLSGGEAEGWNLLRVEDGTICCADADCPDKICVQTGKISEEGSVIACLPHRLIVSVEGAP